MPEEGVLECQEPDIRDEENRSEMTGRTWVVKDQRCIKKKITKTLT